MSNILWIPDAHAHPDYDNERFNWLGKFIIDRKPDIIVCLGDLADMPSLSSYDRGTRGFEGRRYKNDIEAAVDAQERLFSYVSKYNKRRSKSKHRTYKPKTIFDVGNHEARIEKVTQLQPELYGTIDISEDLCLQDYWDIINPFKSITNTRGFFHSHFFPSGLMGRPIGGEHIATTLVHKQHNSCVVGHNHLFDVSERTTAEGVKLVGVSAGCYTHPDYMEGWCANTVHMWWRGIVWMDNAREGYYDSVEAITMSKLEKEYG